MKETNTNTVVKTGWNLNNSYASLPDTFYSTLKPTPVSEPRLIILNHSLTKCLGLNPQDLQNSQGAAIFAGNEMPDGALPLAQAYAGHQFGHFTMLGDGRAILLGEQLTPTGERFDIQLKGSGRTPYSRGGDGRAALGPMLREYIISEAMHGLGIPTTRSLAVVTTGETVYRETPLPGAVLTRVAASHIRVGTFQYAANWGTTEDVRALADYTIQRHYPEAAKEENPYLSLLQEAVKRQAGLITKWQLEGFIHGVMNTDNMAISGETIDYGPCAFMDTYDPATVFSSIDRRGRYAYGNQPVIATWNLARFAEALLPLLHDKEEEAIQIAQDVLAEFEELFHREWMAGMRSKLGLFDEGSEDQALVENLLGMMQKHQADYTNTFRAFTLDKPEDTVLYDKPEFKQWYERWQARRKGQQQSKESSLRLMRQSNPAVIPRNHRVEAALEAAVKEEDYSVMEQLLEVLKNPYDYSDEQNEYTVPPGEAGCGYQTFCGT